MGGQHQQDQGDRQPRGQQPVGPQIALKGGNVLGLIQGGGRRAEQGRPPRTYHQGHGLSSLGHGAAKERVGGLAGGKAAHSAGPLLRGIGLASEGRFVGRESVGLEHQGVGGNDVARAHPDHIARRDSLDANLDIGAIAADFGLQRHRLAKLLSGPGGLALLHRVQADGDGQDDHDDRAADRIAGGGRYDAGRQQDQRKRFK